MKPSNNTHILLLKYIHTLKKFNLVYKQNFLHKKGNITSFAEKRCIVCMEMHTRSGRTWASNSQDNRLWADWHHNNLFGMNTFDKRGFNRPFVTKGYFCHIIMCIMHMAIVLYVCQKITTEFFLCAYGKNSKVNYLRIYLHKYLLLIFCQMQTAKLISDNLIFGIYP